MHFVSYRLFYFIFSIMSTTKNEKYKVLRVTQLDTETITDGIYSILVDGTKESLQTYPFSHLLTYFPEIKTLLRYVLWKYSIGRDNITVGQQLYGCKYDSILSPKQKQTYCFIYVFLYWLKERQNNVIKLLEVLFNYTGYRKHIPRILQMSKYFDTTVNLLSFINFLLFIVHGRYSTVLERVLNLKHIFNTKPSPRYIDYEYMRKEMVWDQTTNTILAIIPFVNFQKVFYQLNKQYRRIFPSTVSTTQGRSHEDILKCGICLEQVINPYITSSCHHIFCYFCLQGNVSLHQDFSCPYCGVLLCGEDMKPLKWIKKDE